ncbi:MAG: LysE family transporter, partial [Tepidisphaeraceae bacterium]
MDAGLLAKGVLFGLGAAATIGPVNIEIARRTLRAGFGAGFALGCGAVSVDVAYAILSAFGISPLLKNKFFYWPLSAGAIGLLGYLGVMSLRCARTIARADVLD